MMGLGKIRRGIERVVSNVRSVGADRSAILLYHRIARVEADPWRLCVSPENFEAHLQLLKASFRVMSLSELVANLARGKAPANAVAITFDDGYLDNLLTAKPLLERYCLPATVFVASGAVGSDIDFWWDQLATLLLVPSRLPPVLAVELGEQSWRWETGDRARLHGSVYEALRTLDRHRALQALDQIAAWSQAEDGWRNRNPTLDPDQLRELARGGLVEIGAHTVNHPVLAALPIGEQRDEIVTSGQHLAAMTGTRIANFAYPHGGLRDFNAQTARLVEQAGFESACAAEDGVALEGCDRFALPRVSIGDLDGAVFERKLRQWLRG